MWATSPSGWYIGKLVAKNATTAYSTSVTLAVPLAGGYQIRVGYRPVAGSGSWMVFGASGGSFTVAAPALAITLPTITGSYAQNSTLPVSWTTNQALASGQFAVWVRSASGWYVGKLVAVNGTASYATSVSLAVPLTGGYQIRVGYRPTAGSGSWTVFGASGGSFTVTGVATYYVSPSGDDAAAGTRAAPWRSPGLASKRMSGGDTLVILGGHYILAVFWDDMITPPSGTAAAPTRVIGEAGARPVLAGRDDLFAAVDVSGTSYVTLENLEITSDDGRLFRGGVEAAGDPVDHLVLRDLSVHHLDGMGLNVGDIDHLLVERCRFAYCGEGGIAGPAGQYGGNRDVVVRDCYLGYAGHYYQGGPGPGPYDRPDGFGLEPSVGPIEISGTTAEHNLGDGLDSKAAATTISDCVVANNSCDGVKLWAGGRLENTLIYGTGDGVGGASPWAGIVLSGQSGAHFEIVNVTVYDDPTREAYPVYVQYDAPAAISVLVRNTVIANGHGPVFFGDAVALQADHNDFWRPGEEVQVHANGRDYAQAQLAAGALGLGNLSAAPAFVKPAWARPATSTRSPAAR